MTQMTEPMGNMIADDQAVERRLILAYVPRRTRSGMEALFALDDALAAICRTTTEPVLGQMRLAWWHQALGALDTALPPAEPVLRALAGGVVPMVPGATLAEQVTGWDVLIEEEVLDASALARFAAGRGRAWFTAAATLLGGGADANVLRAGEGWALADLAAHLSDRAQADAAREMAADRLSAITETRWQKAVRPLGLLALAARMDVAAGAPVGSPGRLGRFLFHRMTGR